MPPLRSCTSPFCPLSHDPCKSRQGPCLRSISHPPAARPRLPLYHRSLALQAPANSRPLFVWQTSPRSRPPSLGSPKAKRVAQAARKVGVFSDSDNVNGPPATFHAVQEEQLSCQGKKPCHADRISFLTHVLKSQVNRSRSIGTLHPGLPLVEAGGLEFFLKGGGSCGSGRRGPQPGRRSFRLVRGRPGLRGVR